VNRITRLIAGDRWRFNGDTIKLDFDGNLQDGQHRLLAITKAGRTCLVVVVSGVERSAFGTIDTMRLPRSYGDAASLRLRPDHATAVKYPETIGTALSWLCRYDRGVIPHMSHPESRIENDEIERKLDAEPGIINAVMLCQKVRTIAPVSLIAFFYHLLTRDAGDTSLASELLRILDTGDAPVDHPFVRLRHYFLAPVRKRRSPVNTIALMIKAANAAKKGHSVGILGWHNSGLRPEKFPVLFGED